MLSRRALFAVALLLAAATAPAVQAQDLPNKPIHVVIAFPPGGPTDFVGRLVAEKVKDILGRTIIIENKAGANGAIGADYVAKSEPDGTTLFLTTLGAVGVTPHMRSDLPYNTLRDFAPVTLVVLNTTLLVVGADSPYKTDQGSGRGCQGEARRDHLRHDRRRLAATSRDGAFPKRRRQ